MSKYVVKGFNSHGDVIVSVVCPVDDIPNILDTVGSNSLVESVRVFYLEPDYEKE